jgi:uncharacterized surface protein with fasciclin (FAS1) repeats
MKITRTWRVLAATATLALVATACSSDDDGDDASSTTSAPPSTEQAASDSSADASADPGTIVEVASANDDFETLVSAVQQAGLVETLSGEGPFTVFAPTNDAFAEIPADQLNAILADKEQLTSILTYHVLPAKVMAADLQPEQMVTTVQGQDVDIRVADGNATINGCNIVTTDVEASNGVIHVIDCVLTPPA